jgi:hypothetical protein
MRQVGDCGGGCFHSARVQSSTTLWGGVAHREARIVPARSGPVDPRHRRLSACYGYLSMPKKPAPKPEIEITSEMIEAGAEVICSEARQLQRKLREDCLQFP